MTTIILSVIDQRLTITQKPKLASGNKESVRLKVNFSDEWSGYAKTAIFYQEDQPMFPALLNSSDECVVPWEAISCEGTLFIGVFGSKNGIRKSTEVTRYTVHQGAWTEDLSETVPTPDIYTQFLATVQEARDLSNAVYENEQSFESRNNQTLADAQAATVACYDAINALQLAWADYDGASPETEVSESDLDMNGGYPSNMEV